MRWRDGPHVGAGRQPVQVLVLPAMHAQAAAPAIAVLALSWQHEAPLTRPRELPLSTEIALLVLFAALLHAGWNAIVKGGKDKFLDTVLVTAGAGILSAVVLPFLPLPAAASWPFLAASVAIHVGYFALVAATYRVSDMSYAYPLMRGTGPLLVAFASGPIIGERLSAGAWAGVVLICAGVLGLAFAHHRPRDAIGAATAFALANAVVIAAYTLVDGVGARLSGHAVAYTMWMFVLTAPLLLTWALLRRHSDLVRNIRSRWHFGLLGGVCTLGAYALVLWAMTQAPVAVVAALRETAILFGTVLSALVLKEHFGWTRHAAAAVVMVGVVILRLG